MINTIQQTDFHFHHQKHVYHGKVRDVYTIGSNNLVMIASDRISAFDVVLPKQIPFKGQVLNRIATTFLENTRHIVPNWFIESPHPNVSIGYKAEPIKIEMVIRGYLTGHAWREYQSGKRTLCGVTMPEGLRENDPFPEPIITPSTKADQGHDMDISREEILAQGIVSEDIYIELENYTRALYQYGRDFAAKQGLILVDTKYEFGRYNHKTILIDEVHTPDSSRYFYLDTYEEFQKKGMPQKQLSKEFVRQWLIENHFQGKEGQVIPEMSDEWVETISQRYIQLFEIITGEKFIGVETKDIFSKTENALIRIIP
jgi:phosphoribosylaminoimidazole-succinocarboxamide synthase